MLTRRDVGNCGVYLILGQFDWALGPNVLQTKRMVRAVLLYCDPSWSDRTHGTIAEFGLNAFDDLEYVPEFLGGS